MSQVKLHFGSAIQGVIVMFWNYSSHYALVKKVRITLSIKVTYNN